MSSMDVLPSDLQVRLNLIIQTVPYFWEQGPHRHFTNHGPSHSERVHRQKLAQLAQELPEARRLTTDEVFIVSAAAWLYEIGMQSPNLKPVLGFDYRPGDSLSFSQLQQIREKKHLLTERLIIDSVRSDYQGPPLQLGLIRPADDYTRLIAEVCRWCSDEPLEDVPETLPVNGVDVRVRLLVALLRLADQLYIDSSRVNLDLLQRANLPARQFARWWVYHYTQTLRIVNGQIRFHYHLPVTQKEYIGYIRALIEPDFEYDNNPIIRYLWNGHGLHLMPHRKPGVSSDQPGSKREMTHELVKYLRQEVTPLETLSEREEYVPGKTQIEAAVYDTGGKMIKILFLAANPSDTTRLRLDEESRAIDESLRKAEFRDKFDVRQHWAVHIADLQGFLLRHKPNIVHFSGHGSKSSEIILEDNSGNSQPVSARALSTLFSVLKDNIRCVVLNACYSEPQAQAIAEHIDCVIGMSEAIGDAAAISFASAFYQALGFGRDLKTAFDLGCVQIDLERLDEQDVPKLLCKKCDPKEIVFVHSD